MLPNDLSFPGGGKGWLIATAVGASLLLNLALAARMFVFTNAPDSGDDGTLPTAINAPIPPAEVPPLPAPLGTRADTDMRVFHGTVASSLSATFDDPALAAVFARQFVWDVDVRRDLHKGDTISVLYRQPEKGEPVLLAAKLRRGGEQELNAYRFQADGDRYPSYWSKEGQEVPRQLVEAPITDYEQITSLLKDRPTHAGMDFKAPVGTPIVSPRAGVVTRTNWRSANGDCVEVRYEDGTTAKFLHLNEVSVKQGQTIIAGTEVGKSGNTGRSTAAHLHYQLEKDGKVIDPIAYHGTLRRQLGPAAFNALSAQVAEYEAALDGRVAER